MSSFTDTKGETWTISVNLGSALKLKQELQIDLLAELKTPEQAFKYVASLDEDRFLLGQIIYLLAKPATPGKSVGDLFEALDQEKAEEAYLALMQAVIDFFPQSLRAQMKKVLEKSLAIQEANRRELLEEAAKVLDSPEMEARLKQAICGEKSSESPERSA